MLSRKMLKHILIPCATVVAAAEKAPNDCICKPSELPIYTPDLQSISPSSEIEAVPEEPGILEVTVGSIRRAVFTCITEIKAIESLGEEYLQSGFENASSLIQYLQEEENTTPKYGAVAVGGLAGLILSLRKGMFKKILYTSTGALGMAAICYPKEAAEYSSKGFKEVRRFSSIIYNFVYGVKKDDAPLEFPSLPKFPASLSDAWNTAINFGKSPSSFPDKKENIVEEKQQKSDAN